MLGISQTKRNRYKKKKPEKTQAMTVKQAVRMVFKSAFFALLIVGMSLVFIFIHDVLTQCDYFKAETITVEGIHRLSREAVLETADIETGVNLVSLNLKTIREMLIANPWIADADISRTFPDRLDIRIREQQPLAVVDFGKRFLVNTNGDIFKEAKINETAGMPVMTGIDYSDWKTPEKPGTPVYDAVLEILNIGKSPDGILPNTIIKDIDVDREIGVTLETDGPVREVQLGYGNYRKKYSRLGKILSYVSRDDKIPFLESIDLRNPDHIVAKPGNEKLTETDKKEA